MGSPANATVVERTPYFPRTAVRRMPVPPPPPFEFEPAGSPTVRDSLFWLRLHKKQLGAFALSALCAGFVTGRLLAGSRATPRQPERLVVAVPLPAQAAEAEVALPSAPVVIAETHVTGLLPRRAAPSGAASSHRKSHPARTRVAEVQLAPPPAPARAAPIASGDARTEYGLGHLAEAQSLLRRAHRAAAAVLVAKVDRLLSQSRTELRRHDEGAAVRSLERAARADRATHLGSGHVASEIHRQLGMLHMAAALRARRGGDETAAHAELEAALKADPGNDRARAELETQPEKAAEKPVERPAEKPAEPEFEAEIDG